MIKAIVMPKLAHYDDAWGMLIAWSVARVRRPRAVYDEVAEVETEKMLGYGRGSGRRDPCAAPLPREEEKPLPSRLLAVIAAPMSRGVGRHRRAGAAEAVEATSGSRV